jgi:hypothetical protein
MTTINIVAVCIAAISATAAAAVYAANAPGSQPTAEAVVDANGDLHVRDAYRTTYQLMGTWAVASDRDQGAKELHVVYASPGSVTEYHKNGHFSDGAVLAKEVFQAQTAQMTTGTVSSAGTLKGWFVMVKDSTGHYPGNKLWGDGCGWSWFDAADPTKTTSTDYRTNCKACHEPAQTLDWVYVGGYAPLR